MAEENTKLKYSLDADSVKPNVVRDFNRLLIVPERITQEGEHMDTFSGLLDEKVLVPSFRVAEALKAAGVYSSSYGQEKLSEFRASELAQRPQPKDNVSPLFGM